MPTKRRKSYSAPRRYKRQKYAPKTRSFLKKRGLGSMIKRVMLKQCETKHRTVTYENQSLFHNTPKDWSVGQNPLRALAQGDGENQRTGDEIIGQRINYKLWLSNKSDRPNVLYRIVVYRCPKDEESTDHVAIYEGTTGNKMTDYINTEKYTPVFQKFVKITNDASLEEGATLKEVSKLVSFSINLRDQKIKYENGGTNIPKYQRDSLRVSITAYDAYGTLVGDNIASYAISARVYYKDP